MINHTEEVMGTVFTFSCDTEDEVIKESFHRALIEARALMHRYDDIFSTYKSDSLISRFRVGDEVLITEELDEVIRLCGQAMALSNGFFDPWSADGGFDPTGLVKGWAVGKAVEVFEHGGCGPVLVNGGGDIAVTSGSSFRVGLQHPLEGDALMGIVEVTGALATSGVYERPGHLYHPQGREIGGISASVIGPDIAVVDALATALCVGGLEALDVLEALPGYEATLVVAADAMYSTTHFVNQLVTTDR